MLFLALLLFIFIYRMYLTYRTEPLTTPPPLPKGALLIVEPRSHPMLPKVIDAFSARVPKEWTLYVVHGPKNATYAKKAAARARLTRTVVYLELGQDNLRAAEYNNLFKSQEFWEHIDAEHILVFQTDAMPCGPPLDVDRFGKFGYIGCAYGNTVGPNTWWPNKGFYGVGGLSLRRKSFILKCLAKNSNDPEDVTFGTCVDDLAAAYPKPTAKDVGDFCAQNSWGPSARPGSWGAHQIKRNMPAHLKPKFLDYCPAASLI